MHLTSVNSRMKRKVYKILTLFSSLIFCVPTIFLSSTDVAGVSLWPFLLTPDDTLLNDTKTPTIVRTSESQSSTSLARFCFICKTE